MDASHIVPRKFRAIPVEVVAEQREDLLATQRAMAIWPSVKVLRELANRPLTEQEMSVLEDSFEF